MNFFGEYLRNKRGQSGLPLRKVAAEPDIDTLILRKIERSEKDTTTDMVVNSCQNPECSGELSRSLSHSFCYT